MISLSAAFRITTSLVFPEVAISRPLGEIATTWGRRPGSSICFPAGSMS
jgi:hypothetical protein